MLKKNCYQKIVTPPYKDRVKRDKEIHPKNHRYIILAVQMQIYGVPQVNYSKVELL